MTEMPQRPLHMWTIGTSGQVDGVAPQPVRASGVTWEMRLMALNMELKTKT